MPNYDKRTSNVQFTSSHLSTTTITSEIKNECCLNYFSNSGSYFVSNLAGTCTRRDSKEPTQLYVYIYCSKIPKSQSPIPIPICKTKQFLYPDYAADVTCAICHKECGYHKGASMMRRRKHVKSKSIYERRKEKVVLHITHLSSF
jgi:hypothetical protein